MQCFAVRTRFSLSTVPVQSTTAPPPNSLIICPTAFAACAIRDVAEYSRTQFTGALQGYRVRRGAEPKSVAEMLTFSGRTIDVPSLFIGGKSDWGVYQTPGAAESMQKTACTRMVGFHLVEGAGHWVQQEQPEKVSELLLQFLKDQS